jgi:hypothetical protein
MGFSEITTNPNVQPNPPVGQAGPDDLQNPKSLDGILKKHEELKAESTQKRGRGRPKKDGSATTPGTKGVEPGPVVEVFSPDTIRPFVELPFTLASVWFRSDVVRLEDRESQTLAIQGATLANLYAPGWNPKAVALVAFSLGFATIASGKVFALLGEKKAKREKEKIAL